MSASPPNLASAAQLLHSLAFEIHNQPTNVQNEVAVCSRFIETYTDDASSVLQEKGVSVKLVESIVKNRICNVSWISSRPPRKWFHPLLRISRVLWRDKTLVEKFHELQQHDQFVQFCEYVVKQYFSHETATEYAQSVSTLLNVLQKFCSKKESVEIFVGTKLLSILMELLASRDMCILQSVLEVLGRLSDWNSSARVELCASNLIDICLQLAPNSDLLTQKLCVSLLRILSCEEQAREQIKIYDGVPLLIGLISVKNCRLQWHVAWSLAQLAEDGETCLEIAQLGGISLVLAQITPNKVPERGLGDWLAMVTGMCALLAQLCHCDSNQLVIVNQNGLYVLGTLLFTHFQSPNISENVAYRTLQCAVFRVLRLLFSLERNRHFFKKVFHSDFFSSFIDIGHYVHDLNAYQPLVDEYRIVMSLRGLEAIKSEWESVNMKRDPLGRVGEYDLLEQLGAGAFGCVYTVRKRSNDHAAGPQYFALKEIFMIQSESDSSKSYGDIISEVKIIKQQLRHPNIVRYRKIFVENHRLYIVMDLVQGASLKEHINSTKEKGEKFSENRIWNIVIQLVLALRYLHKDKHIVHRDLKPNNIMLTDNDHVVITDFGLAKERGAEYLKSAAGTIIYSCPEVVQHLPYAEKADIWSFGCCVYEVCNLEPAFYSQNMLQLATRIVEGTYTPINTFYTESLRSLVSACLTSDSSQRPDIEGVASQMSNRLLLCLDEVFRQNIATASKDGQQTSAYKLQMKDGMALSSASAKRLNSSLNSSSSSAISIRQTNARRKSLSADDKKQQPLLPSIGSENIDKPRRSSAKSLSAGVPGRGRVSLPLSTTLPSITQKNPPYPSAVTRLTADESVKGRHKRASSSGAVDRDALLTLRSGSLRPISDPVLQILDLIQKMHRISQSTVKGTSLSHKKRVVEQFQRRIFDKASDPRLAKRELKKLSIECTESIPLDLGYSDFRPVLIDLSLQEVKPDRKISSITYEQMAQCISLLCRTINIV